MIWRHPFVEAVHMAYAQHLPLVISPDMIWYLISSGVAKYINAHAEQVRNKFVDHEGKKVSFPSTQLTLIISIYLFFSTLVNSKIRPSKLIMKFFLFLRSFLIKNLHIENLLLKYIRFHVEKVSKLFKTIKRQSAWDGMISCSARCQIHGTRWSTSFVSKSTKSPKTTWRAHCKLTSAQLPRTLGSSRKLFSWMPCKSISTIDSRPCAACLRFAWLALAMTGWMCRPKLKRWCP